MKHMWVVVAMCIPGIAFAQMGGNSVGERKLAQAKEHVIEGLDKRIEHLQDAKKCVQQAANGDAIRQCMAALNSAAAKAQ